MTDTSIVGRALGHALRHPATMSAKRWVRNRIWTFVGRLFSNPPLPPNVRSVLFICLGNICRSPFAAHVASARLEAIGRSDVRCASAGIRTTQSARPPAEALAIAAAEYGLSMHAHRPLTLARELADQFDLLVVMEAGQVKHVRDAYPHLAKRVVLLPLFDPESASPHQRFHIDDPFGRPKEAFASCYQRIDRSVRQLLGDLTSADPKAVARVRQ